ncbi:predicted protein [Chaetomium globosum CBS 148.51]|uniref:Uncharacterized protein n=1 Tax=Chaetomium globosum (strain ATCC 6205 / CBS 148.51 / DSM 1962 / NBRC 6347 / NRRL 1970) TaxID=306901 RepID=Q2H5Q3_CHAGB|nr:uncharacterized protein CHGG_06012 [Chaetomium globosum CBS 148.51]EAQ89393.1 predicted protein [Chaetomium globosum CBS 148.51]
MSSSHPENNPDNENSNPQTPNPPAAEASHPSDDSGETRPKGGHGPTKDQLEAAWTALARLEAIGVIKPFVVRYPRIIDVDGTVLSEGTMTGHDSGVEAAVGSLTEGATPSGESESKAGREARL